MAISTTVCNVVGMALSQSPIPNWSIPLILPCAGTVTLCLLSGWNGRNAVNGFITGWAAVGAHQALAKARVARDRIRTGNTEVINK